MLKRCQGGFTEDKKKAYERVFRDGNTPNRNSNAKALHIVPINDKDEDVVAVRRTFEEKERQAQEDLDHMRQSNKRCIPSSQWNQEDDGKGTEVNMHPEVIVVKGRETSFTACSHSTIESSN